MTEELSDDEVVQDNVARSLLKAIEKLKFVHPTPILVTFFVTKFMLRFVMIIHFQAPTTIPVALLGQDICGCALCTYLK